jgi:hypothetical protein
VTRLEYVTGTDPTNPISFFHVMDIDFSLGSNTISWYGTTNGATNAWSMWRATNLAMGTPWTLIQSNTIPRSISVNGTNTWTDPAPPPMPVFYRPGVIWTNAP